MTRDQHGNGQDLRRVAAATIFPLGNEGGENAPPEEPGGRPRLCMRVIERTAIIRFEGAEILFEGSAVRALRRQLHRLVEEGLTRLVVNFAGVQYASTEVLGILANLSRKVEPARGCIRLCGLDPLLRDMLRITRLDRVFDVCEDEAEALGLRVR